jgi:hypothetical protein
VAGIAGLLNIATHRGAVALCAGATDDGGASSLAYQRHCEPSEAIHSFLFGENGLLRCARNDVVTFVSNFKQQIRVSVLAARFARGLHFVIPQEMREQGMPDARCTRGLACKTGNKNAHEHTGSAESNPTFPAQWLYGL